MREDSKLFSALLKYWRGRRGLSQLDLAVTAGISSRHLSFLETGRSSPSVEMVMLLGATLDLTLRDRNALLRAAGFEAEFEEPALDALGDPAIERAIETMMRQHEPFPMMMLDRGYDIVGMNESAQRMVQLVLGHPLPKPLNALGAMFDPALFRPHVIDWEEIAHELLSRLQRESLFRPQDERLGDLLEELLAMPDVPQDWAKPDFRRGTDAALYMRFMLHGQELSFLTTLMKFNAPQNITIDELQIEGWYPQDEQTEQLCIQLAETSS